MEPVEVKDGGRRLVLREVAGRPAEPRARDDLCQQQGAPLRRFLGRWP